MVSLALIGLPQGARAALYAFVSNGADDTVSRLPLDGGELYFNDGPRGLDLTPDRKYAFVSLELGEEVVKVSVATNTIVQTIPVGNLPSGLAVTPDGRYVFVTRAASDDVVRIDIAAGAVDQTIAVGDNPQRVSVTPNGRYAYVSNADDATVSRIDTSTGLEDQVINVGDYPRCIVVSPDGGHAYVAVANDDQVNRIDLAAGAVDQTIDVGTDPGGIDISPDGAHLYVSNFLAATVSRVDTATSLEDQVINVGNAPMHAALTPTGRYLYVTNAVDDTVSRVDTTTGLEDQVIPVEVSPGGLAATPEGGSVMVANEGSDLVSRINTSTGQVEQTLNAGDAPWGVVVVYVDETLPDDNGADPDSIPPGGPAHQIGGGGGNIGPPLPPGHTWSLDGTGHDLTMALANPGAGGTADMASGDSEFEVPGLIYRITDPSGGVEEYWLALGEAGAMPNGIAYSSRMRWNYEIRVIDLATSWPQEVVRGMEPGRYRLDYYLQTADGAKGNPRFEYLVLDAENGAVASLSPGSGVALAQGRDQLLFRLQVSFFNRETGFVERIPEGMCEVEAGGDNYGTYPIVNGQLTALIPFGQTCLIKFTAQEFGGAKRVRIEFVDGFMQAYDHDFRDADVEVYQYTDEEAYALEYYRDQVYICNQGEDPGGPILGRMFGE